MNARTARGGDHPAVSPRARRARVRRVLWWVLAANAAVILAKLAVGLRSGSIAILGDAAHSGVDAINNVVGLVAVGLAATPPDEDHPYGHGKFETLGALAVASFLSITCFELLRTAVSRLVTGAPPPVVEPVTFFVLAATMAVNVGVAWSESRYARRLSSEMLRADARHTAADVLVTAAVLGGLGLVKLGWGAADAWLAILVSAVIAHSGYRIIRTTVPVLVDRRALEAEEIRALAESTPGVLGADEIRSRGRPGEAFAELTIRVDPGKDVEEAHRIADSVEKRLEREAGFAGVVVHVEPGPAGRRPRAEEKRAPGGQAPGGQAPGGPSRPAAGTSARPAGSPEPAGESTGPPAGSPEPAGQSPERSTGSPERPGPSPPLSEPGSV